jgi:DNA-binding CsgD family transcriptional regulator
MLLVPGNGATTFASMQGECSMSLELPDPRLARIISEAAFDPAKWIDVCDGMAQLTGGCGAVLLPAQADQRGLGGFPHSVSLDDSARRYLDEEWYKRDSRDAGLPVIRRRGYTTDADSIAFDDIKRSSYYQDFLKPLKLIWFMGIGFKSEENWWTFSIQRALGTEPFPDDEIRKVLSYCGLLTSSATVARQLGFARIRGAVGVLEQHGLCSIALDSNERVVHVSPSAERHLADGLQISGGKLRAARATDAPALARLISVICGKSVSSHRHVSLPRVSGQLPLVLYGCKLPDAQCDVFQPAVGLLVISDPQRPQHISSALMADYFGLTPAEAGLAVALARGNTAHQYAMDNHISMATARNHLQAVLRKTETHRQGELVAALNKIIPRKDFDA